MPSSESGVSEPSVEKTQIRSYVTVKKTDGGKQDTYRSDGELEDDSDDNNEHYDKFRGNDNSRFNDENGNIDKYSRRRYSDDEDEDSPKPYSRREKEDYKKTISEKRDHRDSDSESRYSKRRRRYSSDYDNYDNTKYRSKERRHRDKDSYVKNYVDIDKPRSDDDDVDFESDRRRRHKRNKDKRHERSKNTDASHEIKDRACGSATNLANESKEVSKEDDPPVAKKPKIEDIFSKAGGAYIPPSKLRQMQEGISDKSSAAYQRMAWEALKKSIVGLINKVNTSNIEFIVNELLEENIVRGRGLLSQAIIRAQVASPSFTNVYACLVSIINTRFPNIGELILRRLIIQFRKSFKRNDKPVCINSAKFIAHLVNQQVAHELLALEILTLLLHNHTGDSVEVAVSFLKDVGQKLIDVSPKGMNAVFERLRNILHDASTEKRVQYMIEVIFHVRRDNFQSFPSIAEGLDQTEEDEQITHLLRLDDDGKADDILNVFKVDLNYAENEEKYKQIKGDILGGSEDESSDGDENDDEDDESGDDDDDVNEEQGKTTVVDMTETNLVELRRLIYLTIQSSLDFEECAHKMMKMNIKEGQQHEFCAMVVECCAQQRSYEKFYGLLAQRFCLIRKEFMEQFMIVFQEQYDSCHHLDTSKLRNTAKLFSHLLFSDAIPWTVMQVIKLNEQDTTSSSRIFIKIVFQELTEYLGIEKLLKRLKDPTIEMCLEGVFPRDNPNNTRFAINFFTAIGLGVLTDELREHLKTMPKTSMISEKMKQAALLSSSSSDSSSNSDSSDSSSSSSSSDSEDDKNTKSDKTLNRKKKKKRSSSPDESRRHEDSSDRNRTGKKSEECKSSKTDRSSDRYKKSRTKDDRR